MTAQLPIQKERLEKIASWRETYGAGHNVMLPVEETEALARFALAAHEQEPVAWTSQRSLDVNDKITAFTSEESAVDYGKSKAWVNIVPLYTHPAPVPAVPDERDENVDADDHPLLWSFNEGWNACRTAMLNGGKS